MSLNSCQSLIEPRNGFSLYKTRTLQFVVLQEAVLHSLCFHLNPTGYDFGNFENWRMMENKRANKSRANSSPEHITQQESEAKDQNN